ncbi:hypothetical protein Pcinc_038073, partial [Petrolisthes cinctipes]
MLMGAESTDASYLRLDLLSSSRSSSPAMHRSDTEEIIEVKDIRDLKPPKGEGLPVCLGLRSSFHSFRIDSSD